VRQPPAAGGTPVGELAPAARVYAQMPYKPSAQKVHDYHIRTYESWCSNHGIDPWPPTLEHLIEFAAERAKDHAYNTVNGTIRVVTAHERHRGGRDLWSDIRLQVVLAGIERERRPMPVTPATPGEFEKIVRFLPRTWPQRRNRTMAILAYAAGFTGEELIALDVPAISFVDDRANIADERLRRSRIWIGRAREQRRCPVHALEDWLSILGRDDGPAFPPHLPAGDMAHRRISYRGLSNIFVLFGRDVGWTGRLSVERLRRGGIVEQARTVDIVPLAQFHGFKSPRTLADFLGIHVEQHRKFSRGGRRERF
jgi:integrase